MAARAAALAHEPWFLRATNCICAGVADVDYPVRSTDDGRVVLDDGQRVAVVAQAVEHDHDVRCLADGAPRSERPRCR